MTAISNHLSPDDKEIAAKILISRLDTVGNIVGKKTLAFSRIPLNYSLIVAPPPEKSLKSQ